MGNPLPSPLRVTPEEMPRLAARYRRRLLEIIANAGTGHTGGSLSCMDLLVALYHGVLRVDPENPRDPLRDRYIQSKGHSVEAFYVVLSACGFFPDAELDTLCRYRSRLIGHPTRHVPGIEFNTGALGHGLSLGAGTAYAAMLDNAPWRTFVLLGDGELAEGSNWEAAQFAGHYGLDRLAAIIDHNTLQITGPTREVMSHEPLAARWEAFGWSVRECSGHNFPALLDQLNGTPFVPGRPSLLIAHTVKGRGVSFMENEKKWHHGVPSPAQLEQALEELLAAESAATP